MKASLYYSLLILSCCAYVTSRAYGAEDIVTDLMPFNYSTDKDTVIIMDNSGVYNADLSILNPAYVINNGMIIGSLTVCDDCNVYIENRGTYNAVANLGTGAKITQIIKNTDDITELSNIGVGYTVLVSDTTDVLNWENITDKTNGATGFILANAKIQMNQITNVSNVVLNNNVYIYTNTIPNADTLLFTNVSGDGVVYVVPDNLDALYSVETYRVTNNLFAHMVRSTDYARILNNDMGRFLNYLREKAPDDKLFTKLDSAKNFHDLKHVMSKSVKIHPVKLMYPQKSLYSHKTLEIMHTDDDGLGLTSFSVFSKDMSVVGISPNLNIKLADDLYLEMSWRVATLKYSDDINEYTGASYGVWTDLIYDLPSNNFVHFYGGFDFSSFNSGWVFDENRAVKNPNGYSGFLVGEFGHRFDFNETYYMSPFVMLGGDYVNVLNSGDSDYYLGAGGDAGFAVEFDGIRYDYSARGMVRSDGGVGLELNISAWSVMDEAGIDLKASAFYDNILGVSYGVSLNGKFNF